ncbi:hypothetical protein L0F63_001533, partial [Massospora cicadina]
MKLIYLLVGALPVAFSAYEAGVTANHHTGLNGPNILIRRGTKRCFRRKGAKFPKVQKPIDFPIGGESELPKVNKGIEEKPYDPPNVGSNLPNNKAIEERPTQEVVNPNKDYEKPSQGIDNSKAKDVYEEAPKQEIKKNKDNIYDDGKVVDCKRFKFSSPAPPPKGGYCTPNPIQNDLGLKKKNVTSTEDYSKAGFDVKLMLDMVNCARKDKPLRISDKLMKAAKVQAEHLSTLDPMVMTHEGPDGTMPCNRCEAQDYFPNTCGENVAMNYSEENAMMAWLESCGHYRNIMDMKYTELGVYRVGNFFVQVFGEGDSEYDASITTMCSPNR